ncbi:MAG: hypothetical protein NWF04_06265 [Candidatus Bathyarchaeota archaeon]|nr:hypothetical protein [Candidatus Bathyarchaeota archaeon]
MDKHSRRVVVEVDETLHRELRKVALLNDLKMYEVANAILKQVLSDEEQVRLLVKKLRTCGFN